MSIVSTLLHWPLQGVRIITTRIFGDDGDDDPRDTSEGAMFDPVLGEVDHLESSREVPDSATDESTPLLLPSDDHHSHSLTSQYEDFAHSYKILWLVLFHAVVFYSLAVFGFSYLVESWSVTDALYYATTLFCTIGFGDIAPDTVEGRLYTIFLALYGIAFLGIFIGALGEYLVQRDTQATEDLRRKVGTQVVHHLMDDSTKEEGTSAVALPEDVFSSSVREKTRERSLWHDVCSILLLEAPIMTLVILLALGVGYLEGWTILESMYWLVISGTTVGLGDYHPNLDSVRLFCVFFLPFAVAVLGDLLGRIASVYMDRQRRRAEKNFLSRALTLCDLTTMDTDGDGRVDKVEFLSYMLCALQKVSKEDIQEIGDLFHKLDVDGTSYLTKDDLVSRHWDSSFRSSLATSMSQCP